MTDPEELEMDVIRKMNTCCVKHVEERIANALRIGANSIRKRQVGILLAAALLYERDNHLQKECES